MESFLHPEDKDEGRTLDIPKDGQTPEHCKMILIVTRPRWGSAVSPYLAIRCEDELHELVQGVTGHACYVLANKGRHISS